MFPLLEEHIACAATHYHQLLEEARIERLIRASRPRSASLSKGRGLLFGFGKLLIRLGQYIQASCGDSPLSVSVEELPELQMR